MTYALIVNGTIQTIGGLPAAARRIDSGEWVCPVGGAWTAPQIAACGYVQVVGVARPADTDATTYDYSVTLVAGVPTETWTARPKTQSEIDYATQTTTRSDILQQLADGVAQIQTVRAAASSDIATADAAQSQALTVKGQATTQKGTVSSAAVPATYQTSTITFLRDQLAAVIARQELITQAIADGFAYRKAVDQNALVTDDALIGLARIISGRITG